MGFHNRSTFCGRWNVRKAKQLSSLLSKATQCSMLWHVKYPGYPCMNRVNGRLPALSSHHYFSAGHKSWLNFRSEASIQYHTIHKATIQCKYKARGYPVATRMFYAEASKRPWTMDIPELIGYMSYSQPYHLIITSANGSSYILTKLQISSIETINVV